MPSRTTPSDAETACFEVGIKFGSLYHQFAGTPVTAASASALATAMEESIENQPYCESVSVAIDTAAIEEELSDVGHDYTELTGRLLSVRITVAYEGTRVEAEMEMEDGYPLMSLSTIEN